MPPPGRWALAACAVIAGGAIIHFLTRASHVERRTRADGGAAQPVAVAPMLSPTPRAGEVPPPAGPPQPSMSVVGSKPESEAVYMRELARLARTDKPRALVLAQKGDEWYPTTGDTAEARKAMIVTLLVDLGNMEEARALTRRFIAAFPSSPYRPIVQGVTGIHPRPHGPSGVEE